MTEEEKDKAVVKALRYEYIGGFGVYQWPEFEALMRRLGIDYDAASVGITIRVFIDEAVKVTHETLGQDMTKECPKQ